MARKNRDKGNWSFMAFVLLLALCVPGGGFGFDAPRSNEFQRGDNKELPFLTFYTKGLATTPQLAFWQAVEKGRILEKCNIRVRLWKNLDDLQALLLAGKGDLWLGHTDCFVKAGLQGAPVQLLLTTGWRKFYLISSNPQTLYFRDFIGKSLAFTPKGSPAVPVLRSLGNNEFAGISFVPYESNDLMIKLMQGSPSAALLPEPLVTRILFSRTDLMTGENVEDLYGQYTGRMMGMPIAGFAVNSQTARKYPEIISWIAKETMEQTKILAKDPLKGVDSLPGEFLPFISRTFIRASLQRDSLYGAYSCAVRSEIEDYMNIILSPAIPKNNPLPDSLFWK